MRCRFRKRVWPHPFCPTGHCRVRRGPGYLLISWGRPLRRTLVWIFGFLLRRLGGRRGRPFYVLRRLFWRRLVPWMVVHDISWRTMGEVAYRRGRKKALRVWNDILLSIALGCSLGPFLFFLCSLFSISCSLLRSSSFCFLLKEAK